MKQDVEQRAGLYQARNLKDAVLVSILYDDVNLASLWTVTLVHHFSVGKTLSIVSKHSNILSQDDNLGQMVETLTQVSQTYIKTTFGRPTFGFWNGADHNPVERQPVYKGTNSCKNVLDFDINRCDKYFGESMYTFELVSKALVLWIQGNTKFFKLLQFCWMVISPYEINSSNTKQNFEYLCL